MIKTLFAFLTIFFTSTVLCATTITNYTLPSDTINQINNLGQKSGCWLVKNKSGQRTEEGFYVEGKKTGVWTAYYSNGNKKHEITFIKGEARGLAKFYYENGNLWESGNWQVNRWEGNYKFYYKNGKLSYDWNYDAKGKRTGNQKYYHENGALKYSGKWEDGKTTGTLKIFNEKGVLVQEKTYTNGRVTKSKKIQHPKSQTVSDSAKPQHTPLETTKFTGSGFHTIFNLNGSIDEKGKFNNGKLIDGEKYQYDSNGKLLKIIMIKEGKEAGQMDPPKK